MFLSCLLPTLLLGRAWTAYEVPPSATSSATKAQSSLAKDDVRGGDASHYLPWVSGLREVSASEGDLAGRLYPLTPGHWCQPLSRCAPRGRRNPLAPATARISRCKVTPAREFAPRLRTFSEHRCHRGRLSATVQSADSALRAGSWPAVYPSWVFSIALKAAGLQGPGGSNPSPSASDPRRLAVSSPGSRAKHASPGSSLPGGRPEAEGGDFIPPRFTSA